MQYSQRPDSLGFKGGQVDLCYSANLAFLQVCDTEAAFDFYSSEEGYLY